MTPAAGARRAGIPGETYFFRDHGQFHVIRTQLLPALLARRSATRELRVWSAGCSTGEEAYSLAIVVNELLPPGESWKVTVVATDVDEDALERARRGLYPAWSFRMVDPGIRQRYFQRQGAEWELARNLRRMVTFLRHDLLRDPLPLPGTALSELDLVLCRNLFIYFPRQAVTAMVMRLAGALAPGGFLLTGHAEVDDASEAALETMMFAESVVYRRPETTAGVAAALRRQRRHVPIAPSRAHTIVMPPEAGARPRQGGDTLRQQAREAANVGRYDEATRLLEAAIASEGPSADTYYLLAHLAEERSARAEAHACFRKVLYLDPSYVPAYVELAALHDAEGNATRAQRMREAAIACLDRMPPDAAIEVYEVTAAELRVQLAAVVK